MCLHLENIDKSSPPLTIGLKHLQLFSDKKNGIAITTAPTAIPTPLHLGAQGTIPSIFYRLDDRLALRPW